MGKSFSCNNEARTAAGSRSVGALFFFFFRVSRGFALLVVLLVPFTYTSNAQDLDRFSKAIADGDEEQKREALFQIRNLRSEAASRVAVPALKDSDPIVRATAAASVVFLPKQEAISVLNPLLADRDAFVRKEAAYAMGRVENPDAAAPLASLLQREKDLEVRAAAVIGLGVTGNPASVEPLLAVLKGSPSGDTEFLRRSAARSIGQIAQIVRTSDGYVVTPQNFLPEKYKSISGDDLAAKFIVFNAAVPILNAVLQNRQEADDTRREAAFALGSIGSGSARTALEAHRNSPDPYLAEISGEALLKIDATQRTSVNKAVWGPKRDALIDILGRISEPKTRLAEPGTHENGPSGPAYFQIGP